MSYRGYLGARQGNGSVGVLRAKQNATSTTIDGNSPQRMNRSTTSIPQRAGAFSSGSGPLPTLQAPPAGVRTMPPFSNFTAVNKSLDQSKPAHREPFLPSQKEEDQGKYTIVFDLDETLVSNRRPGKAILRPHLAELLRSLVGNAELVLWTASMECVAVPVLQQMDAKGGIFSHCIFRDRRWYDERGYTKDLRLLGRDMSKTVIVENSPNSVRLNKKNSIMVPDFMGGAWDNALPVVKEILIGLLQSGKPVDEYLSECPLIKQTTHDIVIPPKQIISAGRKPGPEMTAVYGSRGVRAINAFVPSQARRRVLCT